MVNVRAANIALVAIFCLLTVPTLFAQGSESSTAPPTAIPTQVVPTGSVTPTPTVTAGTPTPTPTQTTPPAPTITMQEAVNQAQSQLPPPPPIYDLTDPGIVYSTLREGVNAWIATLGGNTDQFGNQVTGTYVTATRPDVVPASLQAFLLQYYADDPAVGLAYGPEGVQEALLATQDDYNDRVSQLAVALYDNSIEAANTSENVPPLDNSDNGNGNAADDDDDDDDDDDGGNPSANGPATVEGIKQDFKVEMQRGDKDFTEGELAAVRTALAALPSEWYSPRSLNPPEAENPAPVRIQRHASVTHAGQQAFGVFSSGEPSHIEVSDAAWDLWEYDYPAPPFDEASGRQSQFGGTVVHEMTHRHISTDENGNYVSDLADKPAVASLGLEIWLASLWRRLELQCSRFMRY